MKNRNSSDIIYLDNNATTQICPEVEEKINYCLKNLYGNPSSLHIIGNQSAVILKECEKSISNFPGGPWKVLFTSGGTEADAIAVFSQKNKIKNKNKNKKIIISSIEHPAIRENVYYLKELYNIKIEELPVDKNGIVIIDKFKETLNKDVITVFVMLANNEIGSIQPVQEIGFIIKQNFPEIHFHVDAVAAFGQVIINDKLFENVDSLSLSAHKFYGPKGSGALLYKPKAKIKPIWKGGLQQNSLRPGTENIYFIAGFETAFNIIMKQQKDNIIKLKKFRTIFWEKVHNSLPEAKLLGHPQLRAEGNLCIAYPEIDSEPLIHLMEAKGLIASSGTACHSRLKQPSHVIKAIELSGQWAITRFGFSIFLNDTIVENAASIYIDSVMEFVNKKKNKTNSSKG